MRTATLRAVTATLVVTLVTIAIDMTTFTIIVIIVNTWPDLLEVSNEKANKSGVDSPLVVRASGGVSDGASGGVSGGVSGGGASGGSNLVRRHVSSATAACQGSVPDLTEETPATAISIASGIAVTATATRTTAHSHTVGSEGVPPVRMEETIQNRLSIEGR